MNIKTKTVFIVSLSIALVAGCVTNRQVNDSGTETMKTVIEDLNEGMTFNQVVDLLDKNDVEYSTYDSEPKIRGIFRRVEGGTRLAQKSVQFYLFFDQNDQLERKELEEVFTGM